MADEYIRREDAVKRLDPYRRFEIIQDAIDYIESLEPADVAPVRHGHWTLVGWHKGMKVVECSCCKKRAIGSTDFCPKCGAKMDREE